MKKNIAIIGSGISGLSCAYLLAKKHKISVFEKASTIGGHTATVDVDLNGQHYAIDTGFIVFNDRTYPNFLALLAEIGVDKQPTEMSFSVKNPMTQFEYNGHNINTLFAQRRNLVRPAFWQLLYEIIRFNKACQALYQSKQVQDGYTLGDFLNDHQFSDYFALHYILPMGAAIWSSSIDDMNYFPLRFFIQFFHNHGLLNISNRPQWYVIPGGSRNYLAPLTKSFEKHIHLNSTITKVTRHDDCVQIHFADNSIQVFDDVVFACHSDQAMTMLDDISAQERQVLGDIPYQANQVVLHTDETILPKNKRAWASWNYQLTGDQSRPACVSYYMNRLQGLNSFHHFCVTLNQTELIQQEKIIQQFEYHHPVFNLRSMAAQQKRSSICGKNRTHFVGAYWYNGFHEDGVKSALDVAQRFDCCLAKN